MLIDERSKMMRRFELYLTALVMTIVGIGCCIDSRRIVDNQDLHVLKSGYYRCYTNGQTRVGSLGYKYNVAVFLKCSYTGGPWANSDIYPATRNVLNHASFMEYSSAASGAYMENMINLPFYPIIIIQIPIQFCLDTLLIPWDLYNVPKPPEGYQFSYGSN